MTIGEWRRDLTARLRPVAGDLAPQEADRLLGEVVGAGPTQLTLRYRETLDSERAHRLELLTTQRLQGQPMAYVIGHVEFAGLDLLCDERALIPRPETEELVLIALQCLPPPRPGVRPVVIDVGTGTGNIALALAGQRPDLDIIATDISVEALCLATENRARLNLQPQVHFLCGRSLSMFRESGTVELIVSNPPYIVPGDPHLDRAVADFEPEVALYAGPSGIEIIAELVHQSLFVLRPGGTLVCEIGYDQASEMLTLVTPILEWEPPVLHRDMAGIERVLVARRLC